MALSGVPQLVAHYRKEFGLRAIRRLGFSACLSLALQETLALDARPLKLLLDHLSGDERFT